MKLTKEQKEIIASTGNIKVNAVAGSGKTTTLIAYAAARPKESRILYLVFNKSVRTEAERKFKAAGLNNVQVETAHSMAYKYIVPYSPYKVRSSDYKPHEIADMLELQDNGEKHAAYIIANHVSKFVAYFCNSNQRKVQDLNYADTVSDETAKEFVTEYYEEICRQTRLLLAQMDKGQIEITHNFYLKKFQLAEPRFSYDYILFDEAQDASPAMLDVVLRQPAVKVIVGDTHQQIYGWRYAINALEQVRFKNYYLSFSFRFGVDIALLAKTILQSKEQLGAVLPVTLLGKGTSTSLRTKATVARSNLGLLVEAIAFLSEKRKVQHIYFEGNIHSYTYADDGASLYDVLNLYNGERHLVRDRLIKTMHDADELKDYIEKTEDKQLAMMLEIVQQYGSRIPGLIKSLKDKHVSDEEKDKAEMIFSTVHRCKGMEYDEVRLADDFVSGAKLRQWKESGKLETMDTARLSEEVNLLYVAVTRARNALFIPRALLPEGLPESPHILVLEPPKKQEEQKTVPRKGNAPVSKEAFLANARSRNEHANMPWTPDLDHELTILYHEGRSPQELVAYFGRSAGAIRARLLKLGVDDRY